MFIPETYAVALLLTILTMVCWGSWANTQKLCKGWPVLRWPRQSNDGKIRNSSTVFSYKDMLNE
jgi:hypothetical protein